MMEAEGKLKVRVLRREGEGIREIAFLGAERSRPRGQAAAPSRRRGAESRARPRHVPRPKSRFLLAMCLLGPDHTLGSVI
jgi:hypothetical protein